jgi:hypothetical protein
LDLQKLLGFLHSTAQGDFLFMGKQRDPANGAEVLRQSVAAASNELLWRRHRGDV